VLLLDRKRRIDASIHTTGIFVRKTLDDFAISEDCLGPPVRRVRLLAPSLTGITLVSPRDEFRVGKMGRLYVQMLDDARRCGVTVLLGARYAGSSPSGRVTVIRIDAEGGVEHVRARYVLAADGAVSRVADDLGLDGNREWIAAVEDVYAAPGSRRVPEFTCVLDPELAPGYLAWVVDDGEEIHVGVGGYATRFDPKAALAAFTERIETMLPLEGAVRLERRGGLIPVGGVHARIANSRGALLGDAAGAPSPLTAGGLDPCLRLSEAAAEACWRHLNGERGALAALDGSRFRARFASRLAMRRALSLVRHRPIAEAVVATLRLPLLRSFAAHVFFGDGSFPEPQRSALTVE
jgi:flavin-dependent dehydrogenase